jgi:hypothetical protein
MCKWKKVLGIFVVALFVFNFVIPPAVFAQQDADMEIKCAATKAGTETDEAVRQSCVSYFEQAEAAAAAGETGGAAAKSGVSTGTVVLTVLGIAAVGGAVAAAAGGGGGGGSSSAPSHKK